MSSVQREPDGSLVTPAALAPNPVVNPNKAANLVPAGTTTTQTKTFTNLGSKSLSIVLNAATASAGNTIQVTINGLEADGVRRVLLVGAAVAAVGVTRYAVSPEMPAVAGLVANDVLPANIEVVCTVVGVVAYGVDYELAGV